MTLEDLLKTGVLLSLLTYIGYQLKDIPKFLWNRIKAKIIFSVSVEESDELYLYVERWLKNNYSEKYRNLEATLSLKYNGRLREVNEPINDINKNKEASNDKLYYWQIEDLFLIKYNRKKLVINKSRTKLEHAKDINSLFYNIFTIKGIFAKKQIESLLDSIVLYNQQFKVKEPKKIYMNTSYGQWDFLKYLDSSKSINDIVLYQKEELLKDVDQFLNSRDWYLKRSIAYKRGYLFYGLPGNGKTITSLGLAQYTDRNIYYLSLSGLDNGDCLKRAFLYIDSPSIMVFEDIDTSFKEKRNTTNERISFSDLLNCLDGIYSKEDVIYIMTTNHKDKLDPALIRAGRIDFHLEITNPKKEEVEKYLRIFYDDNSILLNAYKDQALSMVSVQDICLNNEKVEAIKKLESC